MYYFKTVKVSVYGLTIVCNVMNPSLLYTIAHDITKEAYHIFLDPILYCCMHE